MYWTVTDEGLDLLVEVRRVAAREVNEWVDAKKATKDRDYAKFCKEQEKAVRRREKAANIWIDHYTKVGVRHIHHYPPELAEELDDLIGRLYCL